MPTATRAHYLLKEGLSGIFNESDTLDYSDYRKGPAIEIWDGHERRLVRDNHFQRGLLTGEIPVLVKLEIEIYDIRKADEAKAYTAQVARREAMLAIADQYEPQRGHRVLVYKGRKVPVGTQGEVFWTGESRFGERAGIRATDGNTYFTAVSNLQVI